MSSWRIACSVLLAAATIGALAQSANASTIGRIGGALAAIALSAVAVGAYRGRPWALGSAFFLGLFWLWAVVALSIQGVLGAAEMFVWIAWAVVVMGASVRARSA